MIKIITISSLLILMIFVESCSGRSVNTKGINCDSWNKFSQYLDSKNGDVGNLMIDLGNEIFSQRLLCAINEKNSNCGILSFVFKTKPSSYKMKETICLKGNEKGNSLGVLVVEGSLDRLLIPVIFIDNKIYFDIGSVSVVPIN